MNKVCIYLRKSRADEELEKTLGQGETLKKHRTALLKFAKEKKLNIVEIKEEIVSGDSLFFRPKMLELLKEIQEKKYTGVLVMDIDRLGRGDMKDQGIILEAFKESSTLIITPMKTYNLENEFDEEMTEFKTFFSRRELKTINRRMQGGRVRSIEDGNYISPNPPYGYDIHHIGKSRTLKINEVESQVVKLIFDMYCSGDGAGAIAEYLNNLGYKTKFGNNFERTSIIFILKNLVYIGKVTWKKKEIKKSKEPGKVKDTRTRDESEWVVATGKHEAIIDENVFYTAQNILAKKYHIPYQIKNGPSNPLAGIMICSKCKSKLVGRPSSYGYRLICKNNKCDNMSIKFDVVENKLISELSNYLENYKINIISNRKDSNTKPFEIQLKSLENELKTLTEQKLKLFDLLERGIYSEEVFLERSKNINERISLVSKSIEKNKLELDKKNKQTKKEDVVIFEKLLDAYTKTKDIKLKNELMKALVYKVEYTKTKKGDNCKIVVFPKLTTH